MFRRNFQSLEIAGMSNNPAENLTILCERQHKLARLLHARNYSARRDLLALPAQAYAFWHRLSFDEQAWKACFLPARCLELCRASGSTPISRKPF
jgi:hypothetical protein